MSPIRFLCYVLFTLIAFAGMVVVFAFFQHWIDRGLEEDALRRAQWDEGPPEPPAGDVPSVPPTPRRPS
jgi:hypothetical protein